MSFGEKIYLAMVISMFVSFIVLFGALCWLDAKDERVKRSRDRKDTLAIQRSKTVTPAPASTGAVSSLR